MGIRENCITARRFYVKTLTKKRLAEFLGYESGSANRNQKIKTTGGEK